MLVPGRPLGGKSDKCRGVGGREGHVNVSTFVFAKERLLWTGIVTDSICVLILLCRVGCVWLLVFVLYVGWMVVRSGWMEWVPWQYVSILCMT